jgi:hypothetical protein
VNSCGHPIFLIRTAHDDLERIVRQRPLQRLRLIPWRAHPNIALFIGGQDHWHYLRVDRRDGVGLSLWSAIAGTAHESRYLGAILPLSSRLESNAVRGCVSTK